MRITKPKTLSHKLKFCQTQGKPTSHTRNPTHKHRCLLPLAGGVQHPSMIHDNRRNLKPVLKEGNWPLSINKVPVKRILSLVIMQMKLNLLVSVVMMLGPIFQTQKC
ncbi:hypothetical protein V8G54_017569 [Vigna mungo]|uniref:Uncharacterized protein n=1 Tax=Vigna mungo TaxID=3915 RepID=A0AAQ3S2A4_VIGMU